MNACARDSRAAPPGPGSLREAAEADRDLLVRWTEAFMRESGAGGPEQARALVELRLGAGRLLLWEHGGEPVSHVGVNVPVAGVVRVGPVYTLPEHRRRGFASTAVAAASRRELERGANMCMLLTDLGNPTSNRIYATVGYRRFADWEEHRLTRT